jgi:hypothetical protein
MNMPSLLKNKAVLWRLLFVFFAAAASSFLLFYLLFFQSGKIISFTRIVIAGVAGLVLGGLAAFLFFKSIHAQKISGAMLGKLFLLCTLLCCTFYLMVPAPTNYLLAATGNIDITLKQSDPKASGSVKISLLSNGLDYIPFRNLNYRPAIENLQKGQQPTLVFDSAGETHFSWQGRAWKSIQIDLASDQPQGMTLKSAGVTQNIQLTPGQVFTLKVPVRSTAYYLGLQGLVVLATILLLWMLFVILGLLKLEKADAFLRSKVPWLSDSKWINGVIGIVFGLLILFVVVIGFQNRLYADDYCSISQLRTAGYFSSVIAWFQQMTGRFSAHIFNFLFFEFPTLNTVAGPILAIIAIGGSQVFLFTQLFAAYERPLRLKLSILFSILLLGTFFLSVPYLYESFIWNIHNISVSGGLAFFNVACGLLIYNLHEHKENKIWFVWSLLLFERGLVGAGFNEVIGMLDLLLFGIILLVVLIKKPTVSPKTMLSCIIGYLLGSAIGLYLSVTAPGNSQRMNQVGFDFQVSHAAGVYVNLIRASTADIFTKNYFLPLFLITFTLLCAYFWGKSLPAFFDWAKHPLTFFEKSFLVFLPLLVFLISFAPSAFVAGYFPERTMAIPITYSVTVAFFSALVLGNIHRSQGNQFFGVSLSIAAIVLGVFAFKYLQGISAQMRLYDSEYDAREQQIETAVAAGATQVKVTPYQYSPGTDLSTISNLWLNPCEDNYYGINLVVNDK